MRKNKKHIFKLLTIACITGIGISGLFSISTLAKEERKITEIKKRNLSPLERVDIKSILDSVKLIKKEDSEESLQNETSQEDKQKKELPESYIIEKFPLVNQMPELPTGCEITAMTMVLNYYGYQADKVEMATQYLPVLYSPKVYIGADGKTYGSDINQYFIGDPTTEDGIICGTGAIVTAANKYLKENGSSMHAIAKNEASPGELYRLVSEDTPIVVWCTIGMEDRYETRGWYTENGDYVEWSQNDHGAVLIGYGGDSVTIADPISGIVEYDRVQFESVMESRGNQCVVLVR